MQRSAKKVIVEGAIAYFMMVVLILLKNGSMADCGFALVTDVFLVALNIFPLKKA